MIHIVAWRARACQQIYAHFFDPRDSMIILVRISCHLIYPPPSFR